MFWFHSSGVLLNSWTTIGCLLIPKFTILNLMTLKTSSCIPKTLLIQVKPKTQNYNKSKPKQQHYSYLDLVSKERWFYFYTTRSSNLKILSFALKVVDSCSWIQREHKILEIKTWFRYIGLGFELGLHEINLPSNGRGRWVSVMMVMVVARWRRWGYSWLLLVWEGGEKREVWRRGRES